MNALLFIIPIPSIPLCKTVPLEVIHFLKEEEEILSTCISCGLTIIIRFKVYPSKEFMEAVNFKEKEKKLSKRPPMLAESLLGTIYNPVFAKWYFKTVFLLRCPEEVKKLVRHDMKLNTFYPIFAQ